jgi:hypothetical protein
MLEGEATVSKNYQRLASQALEDVFATEKEETTVGEFRNKVIKEIKESLERIFPGLVLNTLGNPFEGGAFRFDKGSSKAFDYKNLSGGEKAAFDLILDMVVNKRAYREAIYCIDEPEAHMNTRLQSKLLEELYRLLPSQSQLWLASHSIGMMRKARELAADNPGEVAFLDFGDRDFDQHALIEPSAPTRTFWQRQLGVALDDLADLRAPKEVVICEGNPGGSVSGKNAEHDAKCYDLIFGDEFPDIKFLSGGNATDVARDRLSFAAALPRLAIGIKVRRLIDRDDHAPNDVAHHNADGMDVLSCRNLECYLYDDEVLGALCRKENQEEKIPQVLKAKEEALAASVANGNASDDLKSAAGILFNSLRRILNLVGRGNDQRAFARSTLAPLIKPGMAVYTEFRNDIFGGRSPMFRSN